MRKTLNSSSKIVRIPIKSKPVVKEETEPDNSNNEFSCNKCGKVFPVDNTIQGIQNFGMMLVTHFQNECGEIVKKQSDQDEEMKEESEQENSNNEFRCNDCNKVFPVDNSIQGIPNFGMMLVKHYQNECGEIVEKQSAQDEKMPDQDN